MSARLPYPKTELNRLHPKKRRAGQSRRLAGALAIFLLTESCCAHGSSFSGLRRVHRRIRAARFFLSR